MGSTSQSRVLADANWNSPVEGRVILLRDINVQSPEWNLHCGEKREAAGIEALIEEYNLILNN